MSKAKIFKKSLKKLLRSKIITHMISSLIYYYALLIGKTTKWQTKGINEFYAGWEKEKSLILIGWHGRAMLYPYFWNKKYPLNALVSLHQDGRLIAGFLEKCGLGTIGGSSNENAVGSARDLIESLQKDKAICIIPDGPKGPNMKLSKSPVYFAQKSGKPIYGITCSVKGSKIVHKAWDKMMIPLPFSEGICELIGPYYVPHNATEDELEKIRLQIETELNQTCFAADKQMGIEKILPGSTAKKKRYPKN